MRFPRTIGFRIAVGFGLLIITIFFSARLSYRLMARVQATQTSLHYVLEPSIRKLIELQNTIHQAGDIVTSWDRSGHNAGSPRLRELREIYQSRLPATQLQILKLSDGWKQEDSDAYSKLSKYISDSLYEQTMQFINSPSPAFRSSGDSLTATKPLNDLLKPYQFTDREIGIIIERFDMMSAQADEKAEAIFRKAGNIMLVTGVAIALAALIIASLLYVSLARPIKQYRDSITLIGKGVIPDRKFREGTDEMGQIGAALNSMIKGLGNLSQFAGEIGKGNFKSDFSPLSEQDILGNSLIRLRESLKNAAIEEEKRKREDERRNWSNQGIARFSEIMREYSEDPGAQANKLISELVKYLGARVGGIFLIRPGESTPGDADAEPGDIELIASYAYDRTKHIKKVIKSGEGLVGRCVQEGSTIFMTNIPEDYIKIKSGLGEDNPRSLLIVPIRFNDRIIGVIEIASLEIVMDFQIEFVERIGSSIASSLSREHHGSP
jgi:hypothetical protein